VRAHAEFGGLLQVEQHRLVPVVQASLSRSSRSPDAAASARDQSTISTSIATPITPAYGVDADLRRPDDCAVTYNQWLGPTLFVKPDPSRANAAIGVSVPLAGPGREPTEEFTSAIEIIRMDFPPAGQRPDIRLRVLSMQQYRDKCYDYAAAVLWNAHAGALWRRFSIHLRREVAKRALGLFAAMYFGGLRPAEAVGLVETDVVLPWRGWGSALLHRLVLRSVSSGPTRGRPTTTARSRIGRLRTSGVYLFRPSLSRCSTITSPRSARRTTDGFSSARRARWSLPRPTTACGRKLVSSRYRQP
jgi:hypothetical protein